MATTNTWKIAQLERKTSDGYVFTAHYTVDANDGTYRAGAYGSIGFERPETLIPFADLTEEQVIGWVQENLVVLRKSLKLKQHFKHKSMSKQLLLKISGTPW